MARVVTLKPIPKKEPLSAGMLSLLTFIHEKRDALKGKKYPQIVDISKDAEPFKINANWNFDVPIESLNNHYPR